MIRKDNFIQSRIDFIAEECHNNLKSISTKKRGHSIFNSWSLGRTALVTDEILPANTNQALTSIRLKPLEYIYTDFYITYS